MAYDRLNQCTDMFADKLIKAMKKETGIEDLHITSCWCIYYNTVLQTPKFKSQRDYCKSRMLEIRPIFFKAFFKIKD